MLHPAEIVFRGMDPSSAVEARIREKIESLEKLSERIDHCRVVFDAPHRSGDKGSMFTVSIEIGIPGGEIVVNREHHKDRAHEDAFVAIRDAFNAARRQLLEHIETHRGH